MPWVRPSPRPKSGTRKSANLVRRHRGGSAAFPATVSRGLRGGRKPPAGERVRLELPRRSRPVVSQRGRPEPCSPTGRRQRLDWEVPSPG
ncbi:hypothetical protein NDU88_007756 [Pleurodeles waltl]|uniref:Uncharacterized protein n=1 Tax=Pleurodeles waltl TaxID=8319 RepID=A0AAV7RU57_PLEWA|nr:hypothetical protein NDU88_007756 [Pleurodeles waltl]